VENQETAKRGCQSQSWYEEVHSGKSRVFRLVSLQSLDIGKLGLMHVTRAAASELNALPNSCFTIRPA
jgi:hypothetical protein